MARCSPVRTASALPTMASHTIRMRLTSSVQRGTGSPGT